MYVVRLFSPNYDKGRKKFKVQRLLLFSFFGLPSRLDKPEEVKKKRAWNGMEATPFVRSSPSPSPLTTCAWPEQEQNRRRTEWTNATASVGDFGRRIGEQRAAMNSNRAEGSVRPPPRFGFHLFVLTQSFDDDDGSKNQIETTSARLHFQMKLDVPASDRSWGT